MVSILVLIHIVCVHLEMYKKKTIIKHFLSKIFIIVAHKHRFGTYITSVSPLLFRMLIKSKVAPYATRDSH